MAKKRKKKTDFRTLLITLSVAFCIVFFIIKISFGNLGWIEVFSPIILVFVILFIINLLKTVVRKV